MSARQVRRPEVSVELDAEDAGLRVLEVRRLLRRIERGLLEELAWVAQAAFDEALLATVRRRAEEVVLPFWREGALQGRTAGQACFVRCDATTMTPADLDAGRIVVVVGVAPLRPAEFVVLRIGLWTSGHDRGEA